MSYSVDEKIRAQQIINDIDVSVDWNPKVGAICPLCQTVPMPKSANITSANKWEGNTRIRYHKCAGCGWTFKSVERDPTI